MCPHPAGKGQLLLTKGKYTEMRTMTQKNKKRSRRMARHRQNKRARARAKTQKLYKNGHFFFRRRKKRRRGCTFSFFFSFLFQLFCLFPTFLFVFFSRSSFSVSQILSLRRKNGSMANRVDPTAWANKRKVSIHVFLPSFF